MQTINLPTTLVQAIANYLATKPYTEVFQLIAALQQAAQVKPEEPEKEKTKEEEE